MASLSSFADEKLQNEAAQLRLAVVITGIGIPSEVWALRQCRAFERFDPVLTGWSVDPDGETPKDIETRIVEGDFTPPATVFRKVKRKAGLASALAITPCQRAALRRALAGTEGALCHFAWTAMAVSQAMPPDYPVIWHVHGRDVSSQFRYPAYRAMLRRQLPRAAGLVAVGQHQLDRLAPFGLPAQTALIPCGAPLDLFAAHPLPDQSASDTVRFGSVGRLSHEKGMIETLSAFERVATRLPGAELVLIGFGPLMGELTARVAASPAADRIRLTGRLAPEDIAAELRQCHVYLQHSREIEGWVEGFGVTLTEAGAIGLPLLASASGGLKDQIVEGENGHLFPPGDIDEQARLMEELALDPDRRARLGAGARRLAARFDSAAMAARLEDEIARMLTARTPPA